MAESPKMSALQQLSNQLPVANRQLAQRQQAARDLQLQQAIQKAPTTAPIAQSAQQTGAAMAQAAGQQQLQNVQQGVEQQGQIAKLGLQEQQQQGQARLGALALGQKEEAMNNEQKFAQISEQAKKEMFDSRKQFAQDEMGRKFTNERQLADYAALKAKNEQDWMDYQQKSTQLYDKKSQVLQAAQAKIAQQLEYENKLVNQLQDQLNKKQMTEKERAVNMKILDDKLKQRQVLRQRAADAQAALDRAAARKANRKAQGQAIGTVVGAVIGAVVVGYVTGGTGTAAGYAAGASVGSSVGGAIGSNVS